MEISFEKVRFAGIGSLLGVVFVPLLVVMTPCPVQGEGILVLTHSHGERLHGNGTATITAEMMAEYQGALGGDLGRQATVGTGLKVSDDATFNFENVGSEIDTITASGQRFFCAGPSGCANMTISTCKTANLPTRYDQRSTATILRGTGSNYYKADPLWTYRIPSMGCYDIQPTCECTTPEECHAKYGDPPEGGRWLCQADCRCMPSESPLVLHLPDYREQGSTGQAWWREGFCTSTSPTVCLDWSNSGELTCTGWPSAESEIAFVVALGESDKFSLAYGLSVPVEPWRHFFGNITMGPRGGFPFAHGFEALAANCGEHASESLSEIDLDLCEPSLQAWRDRNADGVIDPRELLDVAELGIEALGDYRETGKRDGCGNVLPYESAATCAGSEGRCGVWLDVFFVPRPK